MIPTLAFIRYFFPTTIWCRHTSSRFYLDFNAVQSTLRFVQSNSRTKSDFTIDLKCRFVCRFLGIDSHDLEHYSNGRNRLKKRSRAPSSGITCKLPVVRSRRETLGFLDWLFEHTVPFRIYFARARNDGLGAEGVTRTIRETIGNCTIVHREMIVEFRESTGAFEQIKVFTRE